MVCGLEGCLRHKFNNKVEQLKLQHEIKNDIPIQYIVFEFIKGCEKFRF